MFWIFLGGISTCCQTVPDSRHLLASPIVMLYFLIFIDVHHRESFLAWVDRREHLIASKILDHCMGFVVFNVNIIKLYRIRFNYYTLSGQAGEKPLARLFNVLKRKAYVVDWITDIPNDIKRNERRRDSKLQ